MEKWLNSPSALKVVSLFLALFLFIQVGNSELGKVAKEFQMASLQSDVFIENVPVNIYYDQEVYVASGVPETCTVKLSGPKSLVMKEQSNPSFTVSIYLEDPQLGENTATLEVEGLSEKLTSEVSPPTAVIDVQERISEVHTLEYSIDKLELPEDYKLQSVVIDPSTVTVSGGQEDLNEISSVKVVLYEEDVIKESYEKELPIKAYDTEGNELDVTIEPESAHVTVNIQSPSKEVGINPIIQGSVDPHYVLESVTLSQETVTAYGTNEALKNLSTVDVYVNVSGLKESKTITVDLEKPEGIKGYSEPKIDITVNVAEKIDKTYENIKVSPTNFDSKKYKIEYLDGDTVNVVVQGSEVKLATLKASDIKVSFDASGLTEGTYEVGLTVNGPSGFTYQPSKETIKIKITEK